MRESRFTTFTVAGLLGTALLFAGSAPNRTHAIEPAPFVSDWNAAAGFLPDQASPAWTLVDGAEPEQPSIADELLMIQTSENAENIYYIQSEPILDVTLPFALEARLRFVSGSSASTNRATGFIAVSVSPNEGTALFIGQDFIFLTTAGDVVGNSAVVDTDDGLHDYRIDIAEDGSVTVSHDGAPVLTGATFISAPTHGNEERVFWGEGSTLAFGTLEWASVRHTALFPPIICGDANIDLMISATDSLAILQASVGQALRCHPVRCDVDNSGSLVASDALRVLQFAVGLDVELDCPAPA